MLPRAKAHHDRARLPHTVYEFYDRDGEPVYVGCTSNLVDRLRAHQSSEMWREVVEVHTRLYADRDEASAVEVRLIRELQPPWNFQCTERASESAREQHRRRKAAASADA